MPSGRYSVFLKFFFRHLVTRAEYRKGLKDTYTLVTHIEALRVKEKWDLQHLQPMLVHIAALSCSGVKLQLPEEVREEFVKMCMENFVESMHEGKYPL